jgi:hypothetical protein
MIISCSKCMEPDNFLRSIAVVKNHHTVYSTCKNVRPSSRKRRNGGSVYELLWRSTQPARVRNWAPDTTHIGVITPAINTNRSDANCTYQLRGVSVPVTIWDFTTFQFVSPTLFWILFSLPWNSLLYTGHTQDTVRMVVSII